MSHGVDVAVVGAAGLTGELVIAELRQADFSIRHLYALDRTEGSVEFGELEVDFVDPDGFDFDQADLVIFTESGEDQRGYYTAARMAGCRVVNAGGLDAPDAPWMLCDLRQAEESPDYDAVSCPAPVATLLSLLLAPLQQTFGLRRVEATVLQAVSDEGRSGIEELAEQTRALLTFRTTTASVFSERIAFNLLPRAADDAEVEVWRRQVAELADVSPDALRFQSIWVPVFYGHGILMRLETVEPATAEQIMERVAELPWITIGKAGAVPGSPALLAAGTSDIHVHSLGTSDGEGSYFWLVADGQRRGLAVEAVRLATSLVKNE